MEGNEYLMFDQLGNMVILMDKMQHNMKLIYDEIKLLKEINQKILDLLVHEKLVNLQ